MYQAKGIGFVKTTLYKLIWNSDETGLRNYRARLGVKMILKRCAGSVPQHYKGESYDPYRSVSHSLKQGSQRTDVQHQG
jgi:hypothetical protein